MADRKMNEFDLASASQTDINKVYVESSSGSQKRANIGDIASVVGELLSIFPKVNSNMTSGNLNDCTDYGLYATSAARNLSNIPTSNGQYAFWITYGYAKGLRFYQVYFDMQYFKLWGRVKLGETWGGWTAFS